MSKHLQKGGWESIKSLSLSKHGDRTRFTFPLLKNLFKQNAMWTLSIFSRLRIYENCDIEENEKNRSDGRNWSCSTSTFKKKYTVTLSSALNQREEQYVLLSQNNFLLFLSSKLYYSAFVFILERIATVWMNSFRGTFYGNYFDLEKLFVSFGMKSAVRFMKIEHAFVNKSVYLRSERCGNILRLHNWMLLVWSHAHLKWVFVSCRRSSVCANFCQCFWMWAKHQRFSG